MHRPGCFQTAPLECGLFCFNARIQLSSRVKLDSACFLSRWRSWQSLAVVKQTLLHPLQSQSLDTLAVHTSHRSMNGTSEQSTEPTDLQRENDFANIPHMPKKRKSGDMRKIQTKDLGTDTISSHVALPHCKGSSHWLSSGRVVEDS